MPGELKSAWELALEKLEAQEEYTVASLDDEQREAIAQVRTKYQARIAEVEIHKQSQIFAAAQTGAADKVQELNQQLSRDKARLNRQMERELRKIRGE